MSVVKGLPAIRRVHAKNFIQKEADQRLKEVVVPYQRQGLNALGVDNHEVLVFIKVMSTQVCTCREVQTESELGSAPAAVVRSGISETHEININWNRPLFGEPNEARVEEEDGTDLGDYEFDDAPTPHVQQLLESSAECGICYRTGFLPGFEQYGKRRIVLTSHDMIAQSTYTVNRSQAPHTFDRLHRDGWVEFEIQVPKYFKSVGYSVRNNIKILDNAIFTAAGICDLAYLQSMAGKKVKIRVAAEQFTHVVVVFDLGTDPVYANIAQMSKATDWTMFNTIGNLNVILPMTIKEVTNGSIIIAPKFGLALRVTDVTFLRTAEGRNLDWSVNTRVSQPQEPVLKMHRVLPIL